MTKTVAQIIYSCSRFCCYIPIAYTGEKQTPVENVQLSVVEHAGSLPGVQTRSQQVLQLKLISLASLWHSLAKGFSPTSQTKTTYKSSWEQNYLQQTQNILSK